jgi:hypothetical protein
MGEDFMTPRESPRAKKEHHGEHLWQDKNRPFTLITNIKLMLFDARYSATNDQCDRKTGMAPSSAKTSLTAFSNC